MDACDDDNPIADTLFDDHRCRFTGTNPVSPMFRKYTIAFDCSGIIIIDDGPGTGTGCKCNAPRVAVMPVHNAERQPVISVRVIRGSTEDQQGTPVLDKPLDARGRGAECREEVGIGRVCKSRGNDQAVKGGPEERGGEHMGGDEFAADPALLDKAVEVLRRCPDKPCPADHPLITPMGTSRATSFEIPTSCTTFTTSSLGL